MTETLRSQRKHNHASLKAAGTPDTPKVRVNLSFNSEGKIQMAGPKSAANENEICDRLVELMNRLNLR